MEMIDGILKFRNKYIVHFINLNISQVVGWYIFFFGMNYYYYILSLLDFRETIGYLSGMKYCITISLILSYIVVMFGLKIEKLIYGNILKNEKKIDETDEKTMKNE